jgi:hypothetical protein
MVFNRHILEASYCYKKFGLEWSFKYSKNTIIFKIEFFTCLSNTLSEKYHGIIQYSGFISKL